MKIILSVFTLLLVGMLSAPAWSHHAAEGIISDDIWLMIDENLEGTPHLDLDFDTVMGTMAVANGDGGVTLLVTYIVVEDLYVDDYLAEIDLAIGMMNSIPSGNGNAASMFFEVDMDYVDPDFPNLDLALISLYEPIGAGQSQDDMVQPESRGRR